MDLKSVSPLVPPRRISLRLNMSHTAKAMAWVRMAKYVPRSRRRNVRSPISAASAAGSRTAAASATGANLYGFQKSGSWYT